MPLELPTEIILKNPTSGNNKTEDYNSPRAAGLLLLHDVSVTVKSIVERTGGCSASSPRTLSSAAAAAAPPSVALTFYVHRVFLRRAARRFCLAAAAAAGNGGGGVRLHNEYSLLATDLAGEFLLVLVDIDMIKVGQS